MYLLAFTSPQLHRQRFQHAAQLFATALPLSGSAGAIEPHIGVFEIQRTCTDHTTFGHQAG